MNRRPSPLSMNSARRGPLLIAGLYLLVGSLWILFSDKLAASIATDQAMFTTISIYKGWGYVLVTAALLYWLILRDSAATRKSEEQLHLVTDALPALISYVDSAGRYQFANQAYEDWFGYRPIGKHLEEVLGNSAYKAISANVDKALSGETVSYETEISYQDGGARFVNATYVPDREGNGNVRGFFALVQDITERKEAAEKLRLWADAFEGCAHGIAVGDPHTNRIVVCNPAFAAMHKCRVEDIVGTGILSLYAPSNHGHVKRHVEKADQIGHSSFEALMVRKDGSTFPVQMDLVSVFGEEGEILYRVATAQDITERKLSEETLRGSKERYRLVSELTTDYAYSDRVEEDGRIIPEWITDSFTRITGYTLEESHAPDFWHRLIHPDDVPILLQHTEKILSGQSDAQEMRVITKSGEVRWLRVFAHPVVDTVQERVVSLYGAVQDITERKRTEEALRTSEERYRTLIEQASDGIFIADPQGNFTEANSSGYAMLGYARDELLGLTLRDVIDPDELAAHPLRLKELQEGENLLVERKLRRKDGSTFFAELSAKMLPHGYYQSVVRDISERKRVEEALRSNESRLRALIEHSSIAFILLDAQKRIVYYAPSNERLFGYTLEERLQKTSQELIHPDDQEIAQTLLAKVFENPGGVFSAEFRLRHKNGSWIWVETVGKNLLADPSVQAIVINTTDITQRKQAETASMESITQFRTLFEASPDAILLIDPHGNWPILDCNSAAGEMNGYTRSELIGQSIDILNPNPYASAERDEYLAKIREEGILRYETPHRRKDGTVFPIEVSTSLISLGGREVLLGIDRDITERKLAEEKLRDSEERYRHLFENNPHPMWVYDRKTLACLAVNEAAIAKYGYSRQEFLNMTIVDIRPPEDVDRLMKNLAQPRQPLERSDGWRHRLKDGRIIHVEITSHTVELDGHESALVVAQDVTERVEAQNAIRIKDQLLRLTSTMAKVGGWEFDTKTLKGTWTDEVAKIHDLDPSAETNVELGLSFYAEESREKIEQAVKEAIELAKPYDLELEMVSAKNIHKWVRTMAVPIIEDDKVVKVQGIFQDITERKQIEKALQEARDELERKVRERTAALSQTNALLQALMDYTPDHIYFKDTQSRFIRNSKSQASMLGLSDPAEAVGKTDFDFFPHAARAYAEEQEVMKSGQPLIDFEEHVIWPSGQETWVSTTKVPLPDSEGQIIGIFGISRDITERKRAEQSIRQLNIDLETQAKQLQAAVDELEAFSYSVSHDLRAPLRAIDGFTRILVEDYESLLDDEGKRVCSIISREARRMGELIDDLLAFSRLSRKEMRTSIVDMQAQANSVFHELVPEEAREQIEFRIDNLPPIAGDATLIRQVWVNLLANAIKFTSKKERAVVEVGNTESESETIYYVRDNGTGFDMQYANKLFGVFQRLHSDSEFEGTGVGLAIVQRVIHRHGGRVWAEGEVEKGSTFYFAFPRKEDHHD